MKRFVAAAAAAVLTLVAAPLAQAKVSAEEVTERVESILAEPTEGLAAEVDALTRAHAVLHEALSDR